MRFPYCLGTKKERYGRKEGRGKGDEDRRKIRRGNGVTDRYPISSPNPQPLTLNVAAVHNSLHTYPSLRALTITFIEIICGNWHSGELIFWNVTGCCHLTNSWASVTTDWGNDFWIISKMKGGGKTDRTAIIRRTCICELKLSWLLVHACYRMLTYLRQMWCECWLKWTNADVGLPMDSHIY